jgi:hypothetical protein
MVLAMKINHVIRSLAISYLCILSLKTEAQTMDRVVKKDSTEMFVFLESTVGDNISYRYYGQPKDSIYALSKSLVYKIILRDNRGEYYPKPIKYNADGSVKPPKTSGVYLDAEAGLGIIPDAGFSALADVNIGYKFNEKRAVGVSLIMMDNYAINASGVGLQYRSTPQRTSLFKLELGVITRASSVNRSGTSIYTYQPKNAVDVYLRIGAAFRFASVFTLGINYILSSATNFKISGQNPTTTELSWSSRMHYLCPQIGIALPMMPKR